MSDRPQLPSYTQKNNDHVYRTWAMPNKNTFSIKPIRECIEYWMHYRNGDLIIDPFSNGNRIANVTNDIDPEVDADYHKDGLEFLRTFQDGEVSIVLYDPPHSPRQLSEVYKKVGRSVNMQTTQSRYWSEMKKEIGRITCWGSRVISCGWNSGGMGKCNSFAIEEVVIVAHGGMHNDTIVVVDGRRRDQAQKGGTS